MATGIIKIYDKANRCGCVQDNDTGIVHFFDRGCVPSDFALQKGDRVAFTLRVDPQLSQAKAFLVQIL